MSNKMIMRITGTAVQTGDYKINVGTDHFPTDWSSRHNCNMLWFYYKIYWKSISIIKLLYRRSPWEHAAIPAGFLGKGGPVYVPHTGRSRVRRDRRMLRLVRGLMGLGCIRVLCLVLVVFFEREVLFCVKYWSAVLFFAALSSWQPWLGSWWQTPMGPHRQRLVK